MQIRLTVVDPQGPPSEARTPHASRDVLVTAPAGTALSAVAPALASAVTGEPAGSGAVVLYAGEQRLDATRAVLGEPPLTDGAILSLGGPAAPEPHPEIDDAPARLHVVAGPDAGGVHLLHGGEIRIGRSSDAEVPLDDPDVSRLHCAVTLTPDGRVTVADLGSTNGTALDGTRVGERAVRFPLGALLRIGESALRLASPGGDAARVETTPDGEGHIRVPPHTRVPDGATAHAYGVVEWGERTVGVIPAQASADGEDTHGGGRRLVAPLEDVPGGARQLGGAGDSGGAGSSGNGGGPGSAGGPAGRKRSGLSAWARRLAGGRGAQEQGGYDDQAREADGVPSAEALPSPDIWPDPAALLLTALGPGPRLWERGPGHPETLTVRLATADRPAPDGSGLLPAVPVTAGLREVGALGLAGPRPRLSGLTRAVLAQLVALHSPDTLDVVLLSTDPGRTLAERTAEWSWLGWLPHVRPARGQDCRLLLAYEPEQGMARVEELLRRVEEAGPEGVLGARGGSGAAGAPDGSGVAGAGHGSGGSGTAGAAHGSAGSGFFGAASFGAAGGSGAAHASGASGAAGAHGASGVPGGVPVPGQTRGAVPARSATPGGHSAAPDADGSDPVGMAGHPQPTSAAVPGARTGQAPQRPSWARGAASAGPYTLLIVDGDPGAPALREALRKLARGGPSVGVHVLVLAETDAGALALPVARAYEAACAVAPVFRECGAAGLLTGDVATVLRLVRIAPGGAGPVGQGTTGAVDAVSAAWAERFARALAPLRPEGTGGGEKHARVSVPLPQSARLLDELGLARATPASLMARWADAADDSGAPGGRAWAVLGAGPRGAVTVDLAAEGPHLLIEGPAGSGRTELLRAVVASLAAAERPDRLSVVLMDGRDSVGKGAEAPGEGLRVCTDLPHVTTHLTANDPVRMREFAQSLTAELKRRAELLGRTDFTDWHRHHTLTGQLISHRTTTRAGTPVQMATSGTAERVTAGATPQGAARAGGRQGTDSTPQGTGSSRTDADWAAGQQSPRAGAADAGWQSAAGQPSARTGGGQGGVGQPSARGGASDAGWQGAAGQPSTRAGSSDAGWQSTAGQPSTRAGIPSQSPTRAGSPDTAWQTTPSARTTPRAGIPSQSPGAQADGAADLDAPPSTTIRLRPGTAKSRQAAAPTAPLPRLIVVVDDLDALLFPALGSPGRPSAGSVTRALEAVAREGERLGVHLVAAARPDGRTGESETARRAALRIALEAPGTAADDPAPGRGRLVGADGRTTPFQGGRVTGRIPRTATLRPTVTPLEWHRMGDPPARRPVRELGNGPTDLALLASALERAAREVAAAEVPPLL